MKLLSPEDKLEIIDKLASVIRLMAEGQCEEAERRLGYAHDDLFKMMKVPHEPI